MPTIVLGTHNRKKGLELEQLLSPFGFQLQTLADLPDTIEVEWGRGPRFTNRSTADTAWTVMIRMRRTTSGCW